MVISAPGSFGIVDVVSSSLATALAHGLPGRTGRTYRLRFLGPVLADAVIVSAYLPILLQGIGILHTYLPPH